MRPPVAADQCERLTAVTQRIGGAFERTLHRRQPVAQAMQSGLAFAEALHRRALDHVTQVVQYVQALLVHLPSGQDAPHVRPPRVPARGSRAAR